MSRRRRFARACAGPEKFRTNRYRNQQFSGTPLVVRCTPGSAQTTACQKCPPRPSLASYSTPVTPRFPVKSAPLGHYVADELFFFIFFVKIYTGRFFCLCSHEFVSKRKTLPKALRTQALTTLTNNFGYIGLVRYVWFCRFGLVGLVW